MHRKFADCKLWDIPEYEISVKNAIYRFVYQNDVLNLSKLERLLLLEKSSYGKGLLVQAVFKHPDCTKEKIFQYLSDRSSVVRYYALKQYYDICRNVWPDLEWMLLDKARKIRDYAGYILKKHADFDVLGFYKEQLNREKSKAAIWGIGENGTAAELAVLSPYLEVGDVHLQKVALQAYGMIAREQGEEVYWTFLQNTEPLLFVQAYRLLVKYDVKYGAKPVFELYEKCTELPAADYLIRLLVREPSWKRMPYLLLLCDAERLSENMKKLIFFAIQHRSMYGSITSQEAEVIRKRLEEKSKCFSEKVVEDILWDMKFVTK